MISLQTEQIIIKLACEGMKCVQEYLNSHPETATISAILFVAVSSGWYYLWRKKKNA